LNQMLALRNKIALRLGYKSWDDFQTEIKMAKTGANPEKYINDLTSGIQPKFASEVAELQKMKAANTNDPNAKIMVWDWRYYANQRDKQKYAVDKEALRAYFPFQKVLDGMFNIYQSIFGLKFEKVTAPYKWIDDLQLYLVTDSTTGEPLGMFYLDMFPREGKFNHFAQFDIISGKLLPDGKYQRPTVALLCNFPPASGDAPSLMTHQDVETLFHEFGHALHSIVTRAKYGRFAGTHVPGDFVEAPSQMLQNWVWDKKVLDTFAADYRDPSRKIPAEIVKKMNDAKLANAAVFYRRQFAFASLDLALHERHAEDDPYDCVAISNPILEKVFLPIDPSTTFVSYFGHLNGYDAGYYGYAWADAIAADMATVFEKAKDGYLDKQAAVKLRREIYEPGDSRDVNVSIEKFLCCSSTHVNAADELALRLKAGMEAITLDGLLAHIKVLESDEFEGRAPGKKGEELSVKYISEQFKNIGLKPGNPDGTYTQEVPLAGIKSEPRMSFTIGDKTIDLKYSDDFVASSARLQPEIKVEKSDVVFVGHGIVAPEYGWDDYKDVDVA